MCSLHIWFQDSALGYVAECRQCSNMQIGFGNVVITLTYSAFESIRRQIGRMAQSRQPAQNSGAKNILLQTPYDGFSLLLSEGELQDLSRMIEQADNERRAAHLLGLFRQ